MALAALSMARQGSELFRPLLVGGAVAGTFDLTSAFFTFGIGAPRGIAGGLLGRQVAQGGIGVWVLGVLLHYVIATPAAAFYCIAGRRLPAEPLAGLRDLLRHRNSPGDEPGCPAAMRVSLYGPLSIGTWCNACWCTCSS